MLMIDTFTFFLKVLGLKLTWDNKTFPQKQHHILQNM